MLIPFSYCNTCFIFVKCLKCLQLAGKWAYVHFLFISLRLFPAIKPEPIDFVPRESFGYDYINSRGFREHKSKIMFSYGWMRIPFWWANPTYNTRTRMLVWLKARTSNDCKTMYVYIRKHNVNINMYKANVLMHVMPFYIETNIDPHSHFHCLHYNLRTHFRSFLHLHFNHAYQVIIVMGMLKRQQTVFLFIAGTFTFIHTTHSCGYENIKISVRLHFIYGLFYSWLEKYMLAVFCEARRLYLFTIWVSQRWLSKSTHFFVKWCFFSQISNRAFNFDSLIRL